MANVWTNNLEWAGAAGKSNTITRKSMSTDMEVRLASVSKTFTATLIMKLAEENILSLDDTVETWLPGLVNRGSEVTIKMLLNHTSGIHDYENDISFWNSFLADTGHEWTNAEILALINAEPFDFDPGTAYSYSNAGYYLLGMIMESATGSTVSLLATRYIFLPLGMIHSSFSASASLPTPYANEYGWLSLNNTLSDTTLWNFSWDWTAGSAVSTVLDMNKFVKGLFDGDIVSQASLDLMTTPVAPSTNYGYGMMVSENDPAIGEKVYYHNGANPGSTTTWMYLPNSNRVIFIMFNRLDETFDSTPVPVDAQAIMNNLIIDIIAVLNS